MKIAEMLPRLDAAALATVHANALRLTSAGTDKRHDEAVAALPLIEAEQARRASEGEPKTMRAKPKTPPRPPRRSKARRTLVREEEDLPEEDSFD